MSWPYKTGTTVHQNTKMSWPYKTGATIHQWVDHIRQVLLYTSELTIKHRYYCMESHRERRAPLHTKLIGLNRRVPLHIKLIGLNRRVPLHIIKGLTLKGCSPVLLWLHVATKFHFTEMSTTTGIKCCSFLCYENWLLLLMWCKLKSVWSLLMEVLTAFRTCCCK